MITDVRYDERHLASAMYDLHGALPPSGDVRRFAPLQSRPLGTRIA